MPIEFPPAPNTPLLVEQVQRRTQLEPRYLRLPVGVVKHQGFGVAVAVLDAAFHGLARGQVVQAHQADAVILLNPVVIGGIREGEGQQTLLLEVALVDAGKAADDDRRAAQQAG